MQLCVVVFYYPKKRVTNSIKVQQQQQQLKPHTNEKFRDELLAHLYAHSGESVDIKFLADKYCGTETVFPLIDQDKYIACRNKINRELYELKDMGWITYYPDGGFATSTNYNQQFDMRQFMDNHSVSVRLTMTGEIKYKRLKQEPIPPQVYHDHSIKVGGNLSGNANTGNEVKQTTGNDDKGMNKKSYRLNKWMLILAIVAIAVTIVIYLLQRGQQQ